MAIPRRIKLGYYNPTGTTALLYVLSKAFLDEDDMNDTTPSTTTRFETALPQDTSITESRQIYTIPGNALVLLNFILNSYLVMLILIMLLVLLLSS